MVHLRVHPCELPEGVGTATRVGLPARSTHTVFYLPNEVHVSKLGELPDWRGVHKGVHRHSVALESCAHARCSC